MDIQAASDASLLISFGEVIAPGIHARVLALFRRLSGLPGIRNLHPGYTTLLVDFDPLRTSAAQVEERIRTAAGGILEPSPPARLVEIPVVYDGPDLEDVARYHGLSPADVAALHSSAEYLVYFLGFAPGFPYLGGMPERLATPRLDRPRRRVPAGSVAIGGSQTGIYPVASPGGWRIIGRTPLELFRADRNPPALLEMGDRVRFVPA